jgi:hypothetical protein
MVSDNRFKDRFVPPTWESLSSIFAGGIRGGLSSKMNIVKFKVTPYF